MKKYWHIWLVGGLSLIWNSFGAIDFVMTQSKNADYLAAFTPEQLSFFYSFPVWVKASWALAVGFSVLGSLVLLFRSAWSVPLLGISLLAMVITSGHNFLLAENKMYEVMGRETIYFTGVIFIIALALWIYAGRMKKIGILN